MTTHSQTKTEKLHQHHSIIEENAKIFLKKKKMISERKLEIQVGIKSNKINKYVHKPK